MDCCSVCPPDLACVSAQKPSDWNGNVKHQARECSDSCLNGNHLIWNCCVNRTPHWNLNGQKSKQARWAQSDIYDDTVMKPTCKARRIKFEVANLQTHTSWWIHIYEKQWLSWHGMVVKMEIQTMNLSTCCIYNTAIFVTFFFIRANDTKRFVMIVEKQMV